ncbi:hypothetical protein [Paraburkholderia sediminicola]|uniref:hypothetical protein n=1 Tax=Paraburkholderia sediminicola TaxID=458836 RepID=UPI0038BA5DC1
MPTKRRKFKKDEEAEPLIRALKGGLAFEVVGKGGFDFSWLTSLFPPALARYIALTLARTFARRRTATSRGYLFYLRTLMEYGAGQNRYRAALLRGCTHTKIGPAKVWQNFLEAWASSVKSRQDITEASIGTAIKQTCVIVRFLVDAGIAPKVTLPAQPAGWRQNTAPKKGLLEQVGGLENIDKVLEKIRALLGAQHRGLDASELEDLKHIGTNLARGLEQSEDAIVNSISRGTLELLNGVRSVAEYYLARVMTRKAAADEAVEKWANPRAVELFDKWSSIKGIGIKNIERHEVLEELFPENNMNVSNANWLVVIRDRFSGLAPFPKLRGVPKRYEKEFLPSVGGLMGADELTSVSVPTLVACCLLYMIDAYGNVCTALELGEDCLQETNDARIQRVVSVKPRAGFESIVSDFLVEDKGVSVSVPQAIRYVQQQTKIVRKALGFTASNLLICAKRSNDGTTRGYVLTAKSLCHWLHLLLGGKDREKYVLTPGSIRVSGLMYQTLTDGGSVVATRLHAHHQPGTGVSEGYARTYPVILLYTAKVRGFTEYLQNKIVFSHLELASAFGITKRQAKEILEKAEHTGMGFSCKSPFSNSKQVAERDERCPDVGSPCLDCAGSVFFVDFENLVDVLCIRRDLLARKDLLQSQATAKWEIEYLPLLAYAEVVVEKAKRSIHASIFRKAEFHVNELYRNNQQPTFIL